MVEGIAMMINVSVSNFDFQVPYIYIIGILTPYITIMYCLHPNGNQIQKHYQSLLMYPGSQQTLSMIDQGVRTDCRNDYHQ